MPRRAALLCIKARWLVLFISSFIKVSLFFGKGVEIFSQISTIKSVDRGVHGLAMHTPVFNLIGNCVSY